LAASRQACLGLVPVGWVAGVLRAVRVAQADADAVVLHAQHIEDDLDQRQAAEQLVAYLLRRAEEVRIVLGEAADAGHAVQFARLLPAVHRAELGQTHRQVAVEYWRDSRRS
jgi:hypothetical protein